MQLISLDEMKTIQLKLLNSFVDFCEENQMEYFLCGGTLIGAIRHNGYIPWDDDIDVMMPRHSYEKFISQYNREYGKVFDCWTRDDYYYPFAKLVDTSTLIKEKTNVSTSFGVYIDIFPVDTLPNSVLGARLMFLKRLYLDAEMSSKTAIKKERVFLHSFAYNVSKILFRNTNLLSTVRQIDVFSKSYEDKNSSFVGRIAWGYGVKEIMPKSVYNGFLRRNFEGISCRIPVGYDQLLTSMYGNYMELPPKEQQVRAHNIDVFKL